MKKDVTLDCIKQKEMPEHLSFAIFHRFYTTYNFQFGNKQRLKTTLTASHFLPMVGLWKMRQKTTFIE